MKNDSQLQITLTGDEVNELITVLVRSEKALKYINNFSLKVLLLHRRKQLKAKLQIAKNNQTISENNANEPAENDGYPDY